MPTVPDQLDLDACRAMIDARLDADDPQTAEDLARAAIERWPDRLGFRLKLARSLEAQGRRDDARSVVEASLRGRRHVPQWAATTVVRYGYTISAGVLIDVEHDAITGFMRRVLTSGEYEHTEVRFLADVLRPDDVVLELGAGIGFLGTFTKTTEPSATVVAYEANPALMPVIARTQELNGVEFEVRNAVLGEEAGTTDFYVNKAFWASSATHDYGGASVIQVPAHSAASVMAEHDFDLVVMDIEGGEIELLPQLDLRTVDRMVLETHPQITGDRAVRKMLRRLRADHGLVSRRSENGVHLLVR